MSPILLSAACVACATDAPPESSQQTATAHDSTAIRWHLPADFNAAHKRAEKEQRIILIKGMSIIEDDAGAQCATKGRW